MTDLVERLHDLRERIVQPDRDTLGKQDGDLVRDAIAELERLDGEPPEVTLTKGPLEIHVIGMRRYIRERDS